MADDRHNKQNMTKGVDELSLEDDKTNGPENVNEEELNDDPDDISPEGLLPYRPIWVMPSRMALCPWTFLAWQQTNSYNFSRLEPVVKISTNWYNLWQWLNALIVCIITVGFRSCQGNNRWYSVFFWILLQNLKLWTAKWTSWILHWMFWRSRTI